MNTLTKLEKIVATLDTIVAEDDGLELEISKKRVKTLSRISSQIHDLISEQRADIANEAAMAKEREEAERQEAIQYVTQVAEEHGLYVKVLTRRPATRRKHPKVEATAAEIRAWANANGVQCSPLGIIPKRVMDAYNLAHAS